MYSLEENEGDETDKQTDDGNETPDVRDQLQREGVTIAQFRARYVHQNSKIGHVIAGTRRVSHVRINEFAAES